MYGDTIISLTGLFFNDSAYSASISLNKVEVLDLLDGKITIYIYNSVEVQISPNFLQHCYQIFSFYSSYSVGEKMGSQSSDFFIPKYE